MVALQAIGYIFCPLKAKAHLKFEAQACGGSVLDRDPAVLANYVLLGAHYKGDVGLEVLWNHFVWLFAVDTLDVVHES